MLMHSLSQSNEEVFKVHWSPASVQRLTDILDNCLTSDIYKTFDKYQVLVSSINISCKYSQTLFRAWCV